MGIFKNLSKTYKSGKSKFNTAKSKVSKFNKGAKSKISFAANKVDKFNQGAKSKFNTGKKKYKFVKKKAKKFAKAVKKSGPGKFGIKVGKGLVAASDARNKEFNKPLKKMSKNDLL